MKKSINQILQEAVNAHQNKKLEEAEHLYLSILEEHPEHINANNNLGVLLDELGKFEQAGKYLRKSIELKPDQAEAHNNLGNLLSKLDKTGLAIASYRKAIELNPVYVKAQNALANELQKLNKFEEADAYFKKVIEINPNNAEAYNNWGTSLFKRYRLNEAEEHLKKALLLKVGFAEAHNNLAATLKSLGKIDEAEKNYIKAIELKPNFDQAYFNLGNLQKECNRLDEAEANYKKAIELDPINAKFYFNLGLIKNLYKEDELFIKTKKLYLDQSLSNKERSTIGFTLAKAFEELNQFDESFKYYTEGNALHKKLLTYNVEQDVMFFKQLKESYPNIKKNSLKGTDLKNRPRLIFIVGMPRSGTTLVEQIISSHPEVMGEGELRQVKDFGDTMARGMSKVDNYTLLDFRKKYFENLRKLPNKKSVVTDKMPENFKYLGLICSVFPDAKIIHVKRNPAATCWGNYTKHYAVKQSNNLTLANEDPTNQTANPFSYKLEDLVAYYELYQDLMKFWEEQCGLQIYNLNYEKLTENQEEETKKLIKYLELDWEEKCLAPQENKRIVSTSSSLQVRQKVYQGSSEKWKKFKPFLNGVFDQLNH